MVVYSENILLGKCSLSIIAAIRSISNKKFKFGFKNFIKRLSPKYSQFSLGFFGLNELNRDSNLTQNIILKQIGIRRLPNMLSLLWCM